ncbi:MAG TPA: hypothetical protein VEE83_01250 [Thermoplasmata archaeon]|nr:hypothetical protein [Thermoplasmata archaeon]
MAVALPDLPKYLVLDPTSTVRLEIRLEAPACEIDVELDNPRPGRSFVLLIGHKNGPFVQRVRLAGKARIYFDPQSPGEYVLLVANPQSEPIVLRLRARDIPATPKRGAKTPRVGSKRPTATSARVPRGRKLPRARSPAKNPSRSR